MTPITFVSFHWLSLPDSLITFFFVIHLYTEYTVCKLIFWILIIDGFILLLSEPCQVFLRGFAFGAAFTHLGPRLLLSFLR
jgi:hypothetical protein